MTNEEIQRRYDELERELPTGQHMSLADHQELERMVIDFARSLVSQAYEEAAREAGYHAGYQGSVGETYDAGVTVAALAIAKRIRALKDSLKPAEVEQ
jgi:hypothetical protein